MSDYNNFNQQIIDEFRANGGKVGGQFAGASMLLLTTTGAKSDQPRTGPLVYTTDSDSMMVLASKGGAPTNANWFYNLVTNPIVTVERGAEQFQACAMVRQEPERTRLFNQVAAIMPGFAEYQRNTPRQIPVVVLEKLA